MIRSSVLPAPLSVAVSEGGDSLRSTPGALSSVEGGAPASLRHRRNGALANQVLMSRVVNRLRLAAGNWVSVGSLIDAAYFDRDDGGPLNANKIISAIVTNLRRLGFPIGSRLGRNGGYRYEPTLWEVQP